jgi:hypothetical protein
MYGEDDEKAKCTSSISYWYYCMYFKEDNGKVNAR